MLQPAGYSTLTDGDADADNDDDDNDDKDDCGLVERSVSMYKPCSGEVIKCQKDTAERSKAQQREREKNRGVVGGVVSFNAAVQHSVQKRWLFQLCATDRGGKCKFSQRRCVQNLRWF